MPQRFDRLDISFQYPDNWTLDDSDAVAGRESVTVYAPDGSFWSVAVHPSAADPIQTARSVVDAMQQEYASVEVEEVRENLLGVEVVGFDMNFYYLDFTNSAQVRSLRVHDRTYTVFCQGEDHEFDQLVDVFRAMTASLFTTGGEPEDNFSEDV